MKIASMYFLCPIIACCFLLKTVSAKGGEYSFEGKELLPAEEELSVPVTQFQTYFKHLNKAHYNWQMKSVYADYAVQSYDDHSGGISQNHLNGGESGAFSFRVSDFKSNRIIGFSEYNTDGVYTSVLVGVIQEGNQFHYAKNGVKIAPLNGITAESLISVEKDGNSIKIYNNNNLIYTSAEAIGNLKLHIDFSFGNSISSFINLKSTFASALDFTSIAVSPEGVNGKGSLAVQIQNNKTAYNLWGSASLLNENEFLNLKSSWSTPKGALEQLTYTDFLKSFPLSRSNLPHGRYPTAFADNDGNILQMDIDIPSGMRWVGNSNTTIQNRAIVKTGGGDDWTTGNVSGDNILHPGKRGIAYFRHNKMGTSAIGLRALNKTRENGIGSMKFGFLFQGGEAIVVIDGTLNNAHKVKYTSEDYFGFELKDNKIFFLKNGSKLHELTAAINHKNVLDVSLYTQGGGFLGIHLTMLPIWPVLEYEQTNSVCGKIVQQYTLNLINSLLPRDNYGVQYEWRNENGTVISNLKDLQDVPLGHYTLTTSITYPGGGGQVFTPVTYLVGYKAFWKKKVETESLPKSNWIRNTLHNFNNNIHEGETSNYLNPGADEWIYFEVKDPVNSSGAASYPNFFDRNYKFNIQSYSGVNYLQGTLYYLGGKNQSLEIRNPNGSALFVKNVSAGDQVLLKIIGGNKVRLSINGQDVTSLAGNTIENFVGISKAAIINFATSFRSPGAFDSKIGPGNVITSFPCADMLYLNLKREVDGSYYPSRLNILGFRYIEEYLPSSGVLDYKILDKNSQDVFAANNVTKPMVMRLAGDNKCEINLGKHRSIFPAGYYILEVTNDKQEKRFMRFRLY